MPDNFQIKACEIDGDGSVTVSDVTEIQRYLAGFGNPYHIGDPVGNDEHENN